MKYGKIINGTIAYAGNRILVNGRMIENPRPQMLEEAGFLPVVTIIPDAYDPDVFELVRDEPIMSDDGKSIYLPYSLKYITPVEPVEEIITMSKLKIIRFLKSMGKLDLFMGFLDAYPDVKLEWDVAVTLDSNDEMIVAISPQLMALLGVDEKQLKEIFRSCESELNR